MNNVPTAEAIQNSIRADIENAVFREREACARLADGAADQLPPIAPAAQQARLIAKWIRERSD